jgi:hypothetical protein
MMMMRVLDIDRLAPLQVVLQVMLVSDYTALTAGI